MIPSFRQTVQEVNPKLLQFDKLETLQVNLGSMCNQRCHHCHIDASPAGSRVMSPEVAERIIAFLRGQTGLALDVTGGAPELHPRFRLFVEDARPLVSRLMVRTNLTVFWEKGMDWLPQWYRDHDVVIVASLPCYTKENVDRQRGNGVFGKSIRALRQLNAVGYGDSLELDLVYNPGDDFLPSPQDELERDYRKQLLDNHGVAFSHLFTITNAPLGRFESYLRANGKFERYVRLLADEFNPGAVARIMCRTLISVDWQGVLHNCDFNLAAGLPLTDEYGSLLRIEDLKDALRAGLEIVVGEHCYSCTAGTGSSCTGVLMK